MNWQESCKYIIEGVQTLSKRPCVHVNGVYPKFLVRGEGPYVYDENGKRYIDFPCSLGANILGYGNERITNSVLEVLRKGSLFSLSHPKETELAKLINSLIPSMETMRFVKTGSESCSAAVKIARAYTGREPIICCGYHGWHGWFSQTTPKNAGTVKQDVTQIPWGHVKTLEKLIIEKKPAAFITEPYILQDDEKLIEKYLKEIRRICSANNVVLIFDENVTGFRTRRLAAQNYWKVKPDLTCLGKAMANGIPMACVGGKREIMDVLKGDCFVSSTFGGDLIGIVAAIETINLMKHSASSEHIWQMGAKLKGAFNQTAQSLMISEEVKCIGLPPRTKFVFPTPAHLGLFWQETLRYGIFFGFAQFISLAHKQYEIDMASAAIRHALKIVKKNWDAPLDKLEGKPPEETLRGVVEKERKANPILNAPPSGVPHDVPKDNPAPLLRGTKPQTMAEANWKQIPGEVKVIAEPSTIGEVATLKPKDDKPKKEKPTCKKCGKQHWPMHGCK